mmetsp:Transcript_11576/g.21356  ORF Transcript_11576/g.21356 Transcript_11576/m.21356 type:complete len:491 (-) Transcript_11576:395-1867(-)
MTESTETLPPSCDYLVAGAGATGMAFVDSLFEGIKLNNKEAAKSVHVVMVDRHASPGGQWHDSYDFVRLHQPSAMYGVETVPLEPSKNDAAHRATRREILDYYQRLQEKWTCDDGYSFTFVGNATVDLTPTGSDKKTYKVTMLEGGETKSIQVNHRFVDARFLQPDLPIAVPPKFDYDADKIRCVPVNSLVTSQEKTPYYVVIGAGKTGMDAVYYLLTTLQISPANIAWVIPHYPWITARENIGSCLEFLHEATTKQNLDLPATFQAWEEQGKIYRLDTKSVPTKFKDATLSKDELATLRQVTNTIHGHGRVVKIESNGKLLMQDGSLVELPFPEDSLKDITYVHCSAGAFNYTKQVGVQRTPVFETHRITLQDVYGTPGFCFVGSLLGKLESLSNLSDDDRNRMCFTPGPSQAPTSPLGFTTSDIGSLSAEHGYVQRLLNLHQWLHVPELRSWLLGHRLFNLGHFPSVEAIDQLVNETLAILTDRGILS